MILLLETLHFQEGLRLYQTGKPNKKDGETVTIEMDEELNDGVKLIDMNQKEAIFLVEESDSYLIMNFKNEIKETSEY